MLFYRNHVLFNFFKSYSFMSISTKEVAPPNLHFTIVSLFTLFSSWISFLVHDIANSSQYPFHSLWRYSSTNVAQLHETRNDHLADAHRIQWRIQSCLDELAHPSMGGEPYGILTIWLETACGWLRWSSVACEGPALTSSLWAPSSMALVPFSWLHHCTPCSISCVDLCSTVLSSSIKNQQ